MIFMRPNHEKPGRSHLTRSSCVLLSKGKILAATPSSALAVIFKPRYVMDLSSTEKAKESFKWSSCAADKDILSRLDFW
ncbi:hypothetical protein XELAEV_18033604mg [Xenopus laevis]|uniref:Uncharacterized protein n=1 Tax=Xenopus laevis TaxID=8355 RepID=A0A974CJM8_XENLA|nr:hypothetical protein XELAEV_18033604mg [Xenopus laevis]